jgi:uncharacterized membrane protein
MELQVLVLAAAQILEAAGVAVILGGTIFASGRVGLRRVLGRGAQDWYRRLRQGIGRAILLGLELLVGADIIRTVAEFPTLLDVTVLAIIVLIRTFLSFALEVELEGRWPWQARAEAPP